MKWLTRRPRSDEEEIAEYYRGLDRRVRTRQRRFYGALALLCFGLAFLLPQLSAVFIALGILSGLCIGWVE